MKNYRGEIEDGMGFSGLAPSIAEKRAEKETGKLYAEIERLKKIASHVPALIYIKAKEDAGFADAIKPKT